MLGEITLPLPLQSGHSTSPISLPSTLPVPLQVRHFVHLLLNHPMYGTPPENRTPLFPIKSRTHGHYARGACFLGRSGLLILSSSYCICSPCRYKNILSARFRFAKNCYAPYCCTYTKLRRDCSICEPFLIVLFRDPGELRYLSLQVKNLLLFL